MFANVTINMIVFSCQILTVQEDSALYHSDHLKNNDSSIYEGKKAFTNTKCNANLNDHNTHACPQIHAFAT